VSEDGDVSRAVFLDHLQAERPAKRLDPDFLN
jgi:hypothetical protein